MMVDIFNQLSMIKNQLHKKLWQKEITTKFWKYPKMQA